MKGVEKEKRGIDPIDEMIQANKEEADSMLALWGKKARKHIEQKKGE